MTARIFSMQSLANLEGVNPKLVSVVARALQICEVDFAVVDGVRTIEEQKVLVANGASRTMNSAHIGGNAVDLAGYLNGKIRWESAVCCKVAKAMRTAAKELGVELDWGGAWDVLFTESTQEPIDLIAAYRERRRSINRNAFIDEPHFELRRTNDYHSPHL